MSSSMKSQRGSALVETALVTPILATVLLGFVAATVLFSNMLQNFVIAGAGVTNAFAHVGPGVTPSSSIVTMPGTALVAPASRPSSERQTIGAAIEQGEYFDFSGSAWQRLIANAVGALVTRSRSTEFMVRPESVRTHGVNLRMRAVSPAYDKDRQYIEATLTDHTSLVRSLAPVVRVHIPASRRDFALGAPGAIMIQVIRPTPIPGDSKPVRPLDPLRDGRGR